MGWRKKMFNKILVVGPLMFLGLLACKPVDNTASTQGAFSDARKNGQTLPRVVQCNKKFDWYGVEATMSLEYGRIPHVWGDPWPGAPSFRMRIMREGKKDEVVQTTLKMRVFKNNGESTYIGSFSVGDYSGECPLTYPRFNDTKWWPQHCTISDGKNQLTVTMRCDRKLRASDSGLSLVYISKWQCDKIVAGNAKPTPLKLILKKRCSS